MSLLDTNLPHDLSPIVDRNTVKWSGYFGTSEQAQEHLEEKTKYIAEIENKLIVSSKSDFINRHFKGYFLYRFTVILANKP
jgi:hypothetical protein